MPPQCGRKGGSICIWGKSFTPIAGESIYSSSDIMWHIVGAQQVIYKWVNGWMNE